MPTTAGPTVPVADIADELAADRDYPRRPIGEGRIASHTDAVRLFVARREFWLAAAAGYLALAEKALAAHSEEGFAEAMSDARSALAAADYYAPTDMGA